MASKASTITEPTQEVDTVPSVAPDFGVVPSASIDPPREPWREPWQMREAATEALGAGDIVAAGKEIWAAVRASSNDPENVFLMAIVLAEERRYHEAVRMLDRLAENVAETRLPGLGQTAEWLVKQGDWAQAEERYRMVLDEVPDAVMALRQLSQLLIRQGRRLEAAEYLIELCGLGNVEEVELSTLLKRTTPFSSDAVLEPFEPINVLGQARMIIGTGDIESARQLLVNESPADIAENALHGRIYAEQNEVDQLRVWATDQPAIRPENCDAWFALAIERASQGDHAMAVECLCNIVVRDPTDYKAYQALGMALQALDAVSESTRAHERAQWISRTQEIGDLMAATSERDPKVVIELVQLLDKLHRPFESLAWQAILLAYTQSAFSESQRESRVAEMNQRRLQWIQAAETPASADFLVCGVDTSQFRDNTHDVAPPKK